MFDIVLIALIAVAIVGSAWSLYSNRNNQVWLVEQRAGTIGSMGIMLSLLAINLFEGWPGTIAGIVIMIPSIGIGWRSSRAKLAPRYSTDELPSETPATSAEAMLQVADADDVIALRRRAVRRIVIAALLAAAPFPFLGIRFQTWIFASVGIMTGLIAGVSTAFITWPRRVRSVTPALSGNNDMKALARDGSSKAE